MLPRVSAEEAVTIGEADAGGEVFGARVIATDDPRSDPAPRHHREHPGQFVPAEGPAQGGAFPTRRGNYLNPGWGNFSDRGWGILDDR